MARSVPSLAACCMAEALGTFILVFFGCGAVHTAVLHEAHAGLWQVAMIWGVAVMLAIYVVAGISGAHINPAITTAFVVCGLFPWQRWLPYVVSQVAGGFIAAAALYTLFHPDLAAREKEREVERGQTGSEITAMCYGEFFPDPGRIAGKATGSELVAKLSEQEETFPMWVAFVAETLGTALLALVVFSVIDPKNNAAPEGKMAPVFIGLAVAVLIAVIAPITQACFNPAREFGPRLFAYSAGWGRIALPGPRFPDTFLVYLAAPVLGALIGGGLQVLLLSRMFPTPAAASQESS